MAANGGKRFSLSIIPIANAITKETEKKAGHPCVARFSLFALIL
jgi:hypothetical protein